MQKVTVTSGMYRWRPSDASSGPVHAGCGNHAIAGRLHLSEKTVRNNVSALLLKVGVTDRSALLVAAREAGLGAGLDFARGVLYVGTVDFAGGPGSVLAVGPAAFRPAG